jgi:2-polyprenyl-3-methyl-5-hydroxy-6-metoxy-1,4-benzoquinol methylase
VSSDGLRDVYERRAEEQYAEPWPFDPRERKFAYVWSLVEGQLPCEAFLDAGCGDGRYLAAVARARGAARIVGTDISERILGTARAAAAPFEPELARANLESLPFGDAEFDLVLCSQVVEHLLDVDAGLRELARVLRPDGTLILTTDNARNLVTRALYLGRLRRQAGFDFPHRDFELSDIEQRVRSTGLDIVNAETFRFSAPRGVGQGLFDRLDAILPRHGLGDIIAVVARRPG